MINARLDSPGVRAMARHAGQVYLAAIYTTAGLPVPPDRLRDLVAARAKRPASMRAPAELDHRFRTKPITRSEGSRSPIPEHADR